MTYKDILVQIDELTPPRRCEIATALAARNGGRMTGLYLKTYLSAELARAAKIGAPSPAKRSMPTAT